MRTLELLSLGLLLAVTLAAADKPEVAKKAVFPAGASTAGPYTPGIVAGGTLYCAGQVGRDKAGNYPASFEDEVKQALENIGEILKTAGYSFSDAVTVSVFMTDMELFQRMNGVYTTYFPVPRPARTTVGIAKLVGPARIEITVTAWKPAAPAKK